MPTAELWISKSSTRSEDIIQNFLKVRQNFFHGKKVEAKQEGWESCNKEKKG